MLDLLAFLHAKGIEYAHQPVGSEQSEKIIFKGNVETRFTRIALTSASSAELIVDTSGFMALRTDDLQTARCPRIIIQLDIRTTSGHVGGNGDRPVNTGVRHDLRLLLMVLGIQHVVFDAFFAEHPA